MTDASGSRLGGANSRLLTSVFCDSDGRFTRGFPDLEIVIRERFHKWLYLASRGLRFNTKIPRLLAKRLVELDHRLEQGNRRFGILMLMVVDQNPEAHQSGFLAMQRRLRP